MSSCHHVRAKLKNAETEVLSGPCNLVTATNLFGYCAHGDWNLQDVSVEGSSGATQ